MAEERAAPEAQAQAQGEAAAPLKPKKKKKASKLNFFFWLLLLGVGAAVGLHLSGMWDGRPLFWSLVPKVPYAGPTLAEFFKIPPEYSLTANERRTIELTEWQKRLDERERALKNQMDALGILSEDLQARVGDVQRREDLLTQMGNEAASNGPTPSEQDLMNQVARTYQEMSARNAAAIVEQLRDSLAVELLMKLPNDARSSILGKMKPQRAARLTELMAKPKR